MSKKKSINSKIQEPKVYQIRDLGDIAEAITSENKEAFMVDFLGFLDLVINLKKIHKQANAPLEQYYESLRTKGFNWTADGKSDQTLTIVVFKEFSELGGDAEELVTGISQVLGVDAKINFKEQGNEEGL